MNQGDYREETQTYNLLVLVAYKPDLDCPSTPSALRSGFDLFLPTLPEPHISLLTISVL